ncbi:DUF4079 family protein [Aliterella atlantica]|uniref:DUF4079 domain-containing protein n=1 Tax=Aliterella atlantica CENA595 TaxID=1618023 RepID=A0A0D8ZT26_9CYAN|nr:DUF4079 family protein [Aliterella atlantica]KJH71913.1 hypothetical protein UH38_09265 [Aliterella atlantica CENA595]
MSLNWRLLVHPSSGLLVVLLSTIVAVYGWRYRNARLGKSGKDVIETFNIQKVHKRLGITLLSLTVIVWLVELAINFKMVNNATHSLGAIALVVLLATSATIILKFRRRRWASPVHLTLNGIILVIITVQLLSGIKILNYLF